MGTTNDEFTNNLSKDNSGEQKPTGKGTTSASNRVGFTSSINENIQLVLGNISDISTSLDALKKELDYQKKRIKFQGRRIRKQQIKYTEILGVFVALFTFVSINIQIFSRITSLNNAMIFVILMFFCLIGFVLFLHLILSSQLSTIKFFGLVCFLFFIMIIFSLPNFVKWIKPINIDNSDTIDSLRTDINQLKSTIDGLMLKK